MNPTCRKPGRAFDVAVQRKTGQRVSDGQVIATVEESGPTTGPHLHLEVRKKGLPVDPLDHLGAILP